MGRFRGTDRSSRAGLDLLGVPEIMELGPPLIIYTSPRFRARFPDLVAGGAYGATADSGDLRRIVLRALGGDDEAA